MEKILSRGQAAELLGLSKATVDRLRQEGRLKTIAVSKRRVGIPLSSITAYLRSIQEVANLIKENQK